MFIYIGFYMSNTRKIFSENEKQLAGSRDE